MPRENPVFLDGEEWRAMFRNYQSEAWRLEMLPQYLVPQEVEELVAFWAGQRIDVRTYSSDYTERLSAHRKEGKRQGRVHIISRPLTAYLQYEFMYYEPHALASEEIRILDVTDRPIRLPDGMEDFWMFDRSTVVLMHYEPDGTQISREVYEGDITPFLECQRIAVAKSVPFLEYVSR